MTTTRRTDIHRPSSEEFDPSQYEYRGAYCSDSASSRDAQTANVELLQSNGWKFGAGSVSQCGHCGAAIKYAALMTRRDVREFIFIGETCLGTRFPLSKAEFADLRKSMKRERETTRLAVRRAALIAQYPVLSRLTEMNEQAPSDFLWSVKDQLDRKGVLSPKQIEAVSRAAEKYDQLLVRKAEWKARDETLRASGVNAPVGKAVTVHGVVVSRKSTLSDYGLREVMMVQGVDGWKVWTTVPSSILPMSVIGISGDPITVPGAEVGDTVEFVADLAHFPDSTLISKATRPRNASIINRKEN